MRGEGVIGLYFNSYHVPIGEQDIDFIIAYWKHRNLKVEQSRKGNMVYDIWIGSVYYMITL